MISRTRFIFVLGQDLVKWCERWGLETFTAPCRHCRYERPMTRAFFSGQMRGLAAAEACEGCGDTTERPPYCYVRDPRFGDLFDGPTGRDAPARPRSRPRASTRRSQRKLVLLD